MNGVTRERTSLALGLMLNEYRHREDFKEDIIVPNKLMNYTLNAYARILPILFLSLIVIPPFLPQQVLAYDDTPSFSLVPYIMRDQNVVASGPGPLVHNPNTPTPSPNNGPGPLVHIGKSSIIIIINPGNLKIVTSANLTTSIKGHSTITITQPTTNTSITN
jgi:hypothetical protein